MDKPEKIQPPKDRRPEDVIYAAVDAAISPVPAASVLFKLLLSSPLEHRRSAWEKQITATINFLTEHHKIRLQDLAADPLFISSVFRATMIAISTHRKEKLQSLSNALKNCATKERASTSEDFDLIYIRLIDELTPLHIQILEHYISLGNGLGNLTSYPDLFNSVAKKLGKGIDRDHFLLLNNDLASKGLIRVSSDIEGFDDLYQGNSMLLEDTDDSLPRVAVSEAGREFISYISEPI